MNKFDKVASKDSSVYSSQKVLEHLTDHSHITRYQLKSTAFHLEGVRIPSFIGDITVKVTGPQAMVNLSNHLFALDSRMHLD